MTSYVPAAATAVQVRFRVSDFQYIAGAAPPVTLDPGPGPYVDRVRIGRRVSGPTFYYADTGYLLAQDTFPGVLQTLMCAGRTYSQYVPTTERFGTCEFSQAREVGWGNVSDPLCTARCDSIEFQVVDEGGSGLANVWLLGTIVSGPHAGKAPPPWTLEPSGFFRVPAYRGLSCGSGQLWGLYTADLDDEYFRGGDVLLYVLAAVDSAGGFASFPPGLVSEPTSVAQAEAETGGLLEVSFLPTIDWDPAYLARIAAHPSGKLDPTPEEIANSSQRACMLYVNQTVSAPRSVLAHRTAFLRTLDRLGYAHLCDVYDQNGLGHQNNHLAGRATIQQATGYALIVQDAGRYASHWTLPMGCAVEGVYPQVQWYRDWLAGAAASEAGGATLWLIGSNVMEYSDFCGPNPLLLDDMGVTLLSTGQPTGVYPEVLGQSSFTWADSTTTDFSSDDMRLSGQSCPTQFEYDGLGASGTAVITHGWVPGTTPGEGAFVLNANPAAGWNTILSSVVWEDLVSAEGSPPGAPGDVVAGRILQAVLPPGCAAQVDPTDVAGRGPALPAVTRLGSNYPNPFNPATTIVFDLARGGQVRVEVFDVAGRRVRTLVNAKLDAGWNHRATWNGLDETGQAVATGLYFCRLEAPGQSATRKLVLLR